MRALVVYESMFGNTKEIAESIAEGMSTAFDVETLPVDEAPSQIADDIDVLVVGGPTHAFGMSRPGTRLRAASEAAPTATSITRGIREWLDLLRPNRGQTRVAAFDTRVRRPRVPGSAARKIGKRLQRLGFALATRPTTFWVRGSSGPLFDHERIRAREWGRVLATLTATASERV